MIRNGDAPLREIDLTPLIDVSLVLVVMLLLATPLAFESSFAVHDAPTSGRDTGSSDSVERVELAVLSEKTVRVNRLYVEMGALAGTLRPLLQGETPPAVVVSCAGEVPHGSFVRVIDTAKRCGAAEIAVTEEEHR